jgi:NAD(P)-dependent dehydrogenase (short-subunit alcohol dehydrogenase family)
LTKVLANQVALVTGGSRRTGRDIAIALAQAGAQVHITYHRDRETATRTAAELAAMQPGARAWHCEATDEHAVTATVQQLEATAGRLDVLINAVGSFLLKPINEVTPQEWRDTLEGTVTATFLMSRAVLPGMQARGYGRIINIADAGADLARPWVRVMPYMLGKAGVLMLTKSLAQQVGPDGITVNAVSPGVLENSTPQPSIEAIPVRRWTPTAAIARAVLYFADPAAGDITGANLKVGGGWHM